MSTPKISPKPKRRALWLFAALLPVALYAADAELDSALFREMVINTKKGFFAVQKLTWAKDNNWLRIEYGFLPTNQAGLYSVALMPYDETWNVKRGQQVKPTHISFDRDPRSPVSTDASSLRLAKEQISAPQGWHFIHPILSGGSPNGVWRVAAIAKGELNKGSYDTTGLLVFCARNGHDQTLLLEAAVPILGSVEVSNDGRLLAVLKRNPLLEQQVFELWDIRKQKLQFSKQIQLSLPQIYPDENVGFAFSPDGKILAASSVNNILFYDTSTSQLKSSIAAHTDMVTALAFSPNGRVLASGSTDGTVKIWRVKSN